MASNIESTKLDQTSKLLTTRSRQLVKARLDIVTRNRDLRKSDEAITALQKKLAVVTKDLANTNESLNIAKWEIIIRDGRLLKLEEDNSTLKEQLAFTKKELMKELALTKTNLTEQLDNTKTRLNEMLDLNTARFTAQLELTNIRLSTTEKQLQASEDVSRAQKQRITDLHTKVVCHEEALAKQRKGESVLNRIRIDEMVKQPTGFEQHQIDSKRISELDAEVVRKDKQIQGLVVALLGGIPTIDNDDDDDDADEIDEVEDIDEVDEFDDHTTHPNPQDNEISTSAATDQDLAAPNLWFHELKDAPLQTLKTTATRALKATMYSRWAWFFSIFMGLMYALYITQWQNATEEDRIVMGLAGQLLWIKVWSFWSFDEDQFNWVNRQLDRYLQVPG